MKRIAALSILVITLLLRLPHVIRRKRKQRLSGLLPELEGVWQLISGRMIAKTDTYLYRLYEGREND